MFTSLFHSQRRLALCIVGLNLCFLLAGCARQKDWTPLNVDERTRPVSFDWTPNGPDSELTSVYFITAQEGWVTGEGAIWHTTDGGQTWEPQSVPRNAHFEDIQFLPSGTKGWAVGALQDKAEQTTITNPTGIVLKTEDGGRNWQRVDTQQQPHEAFFAVHFNPDGNVGYMTDGKGILHTSDGGKTWPDYYTNPDWNFQTLFFLPGTDKGWAIGTKLVNQPNRSRPEYHSIIFHTESGDRNWTPLDGEFDGVLNAVQFLPGEQTAFALMSGITYPLSAKTHSTLYMKSGDSKWIPVKDDLVSPVYAMYFADELHGWIASAGGWLYTANGGREFVTSQDLSGVFIEKMYFLPGNLKGWSVGESATYRMLLGHTGFIYHTEDGLHWTEKQRAASSNLQSIYLNPDGKHGWAAGVSGSIVHTEDGGQSWTQQESPTNIDLFSLHFIPATNHGIAIGLNRNSNDPLSNVLLTTDDGARWTQKEIKTEHHLGVACFLADGLHGWALSFERTGREDSNQYILTTEDGGLTWRTQSVQPNTRLYSIYFTPDGKRGWVAGYNGLLLRTENSGQDWSRQTIALQDGGSVAINSFAFLPDGQQGWAVGRTGIEENEGIILRTTDGGQNWTRQKTTHNSLYNIFFMPDGRNGWAIGSADIFYTADGEHWQPQIRIPSSNSSMSAIQVVADAQGLHGWLAGDHGTILRSINPKVHPLIKRYRVVPTVSGIELQWQHKADPGVTWKPEELHWVIEYCTQSSQCATWNAVEAGQSEQKVKVATEGGETTFIYDWNPTEIKEGTDINLRIRTFDGQVWVAQEIGRQTYRSWWERLSGRQKTALLFAAIILLYVGLCFLLLWRYPWALLWLHERVSARELIEPWAPEKLKAWLPTTLAFAPWFAKHPRVSAAWAKRYLANERAQVSDLSPVLRAHYVKQDATLDAWVSKHLLAAREVFLQLPTVAQRSIHIMMPVRVEEQGANSLIVNPQAAEFRRFFQPPRSLLTLVGIGGAGKSSLACLLARWAMSEQPAERLLPHRMIPILIEEDTTDLLTLIKQKLTIIAGGDDLPDDLLQNLLAQQRMLIIVDALSEKSRAMQEHIVNLYAKCPAHALLVTARRPFQAAGATQSMVRPEEITVDRLAYFLIEYLRLSGHENLFPRRKALELADRLLSIAEADGKDLPLTPLLIVLFVKQAIELAEQGQDMTQLPGSIPETMIKYLKQLNTSKDVSEDDLIKATLVLARCSLGDNYIPQDFERQRAIATLNAATLWRDDSYDVLQELVGGGILEQRELAGTKFYRFKFDPVAEYMAALERVRTLNHDAAAWTQWLNALKQVDGYPRRMDGFLVALEVCVSTYQQQFNLPTAAWPWVADNGAPQPVVQAI